MDSGRTSASTASSLTGGETPDILALILNNFLLLVKISEGRLDQDENEDCSLFLVSVFLLSVPAVWILARTIWRRKQRSATE